jgi:hypothetical protein
LADSYQKRIEHLTDLQKFPLSTSQDMKHREILSSEILFSLEDLKTENEEYIRIEETFEKRLDTLQKEIDSRYSGNPNDINIARLKGEMEQIQTQFKSVKRVKKIEIGKLNTHIQYLKLKKKQIPVLFFFGGIWLIIFGGMVYAFVISYLGNVYHKVFVFSNEKEKTYWSATISNIRKKDPKQPLLGGTLFILTSVLIYFLFLRFSIFAGIFSLVNDLIGY